MPCTSSEPQVVHELVPQGFVSDLHFT